MNINKTPKLDTNLKRINYEKSISKKLNSYIGKNVKMDYKKNEVLLKIQEKIKNIENFGFMKESFKDIIKNKREVLLYCDYDNDGLSAGTAMSDFLDMYDVPYTIVFSDRKNDGYGLKLENIKNKKEVKEFIEKNKNNKNPKYVCSLDNGVNNDEVNDILKKQGFKYLSIDHHKPDKDQHNKYCMNPHLNPDNISDEENLCTGMLVYGFCLSMFDEKERMMKKNYLLKNLDMAILSTLSDYMKLDGINRGIIRHFSGDMLNYARPSVRNLINFNNAFFQKTKIYETLSGSVISLLNSVGRLKNMDLAYGFLTGKGDFGLDDLVSLNENKKEMVNEYLEKIMSNIDEESNVIIYDHDDIEGGITSIISSRLAITENKVTLIGHSDGFDKIRYSIRSPFYGHVLSKEFEKLGQKYKGHDVAGVVEIGIEERDNFEKEVKKLFDSQELISEPYYVLDTISDGDLITSELLDLVYSFGPYGAGIKEPVFKVKGKFLKGSNGIFLSKSASGKTQLLSIKVGNKIFRFENNTGKILSESDIEKIKEPVVKISYPYPNQNKNVLKMIDY